MRALSVVAAGAAAGTTAGATARCSGLEHPASTALAASAIHRYPRILPDHGRGAHLIPQPRVGVLHLDHFIAAEGHERDLPRRYAVHPVLHLEPVFGLARLVLRLPQRH